MGHRLIARRPPRIYHSGMAQAVQASEAFGGLRARSHWTNPLEREMDDPGMPQSNGDGFA